ncbi:MAG: DUF1501 domain-containing protein [Planctomycetes bacterium]|nr:DUF1501 domain-containing protein [Planctomycetota bacterium]
MNRMFAKGRREFMRIGALALGGLTLADVLRAHAAGDATRRDTSVILLYQHGGASHLETYDLKTDAPENYRSQFQPISTVVPGLEICEHFPLQARLADKFSIIRSLHHDVNIHSDGGIVVLTGKRPERLDPTSQSKSDHPDFGSIASRVRGFGPHSMPPYVAIPQKPYMTRPTYLGLQHGAFELGDPNSGGYRPPHARLLTGRESEVLQRRDELLKRFDQLRRQLAADEPVRVIDDFRERALELLTSADAASAFDLAQEPDTLREKYGRHTWGQACLLARRLAEAGTAVINIYFDTPRSGPEFTNWDDHPGNAGRPGHFARFMATRLPYMDQALSALIEDIHDRGLSEQILVVVVGEFGRTPIMRYGPPDNSYGRDHWPDAYSALVSGGGLRMGQVVGATNSKGEYPAQSPYTPQDLLGMIYRHLGIEHQQAFHDFSGRPIPVLDRAKPIRELL